MRERPLAGLRVVVCRPLEQAADLAERLEAAGAQPVIAPVIAVTDPPDGGAALRSALAGLKGGDWLVVTSPNGATRVGEALAKGAGDGRPTPVGEPLVGSGVRVAAIGPGTARAAAEAGLPADLVPERSVAEGLVEAFGTPSASDGSGRVVLARAEVARAALPDGLRAAGWEVEDVAAYRTVTRELTAEQRSRVAAADGVVFTSSSTVDRLVDAVGTDAVPPLVVSIGPATSATAASYDLAVTVEAAEHTIEGAVAALIAHASTWPS